MALNESLAHVSKTSAG